MVDDNYGLSMFLWLFSFSLFCIAIVHLIFSDVGLTLFLACITFIVSSLWGIGTAGGGDKIIRYWRVNIATVDGSVYVLDRHLSFADAQKLRDDTVAKFNNKNSTISVECKNSDGLYGTRNFNKVNIVHIGWLED
jgi:hypothetical protein